jgi:L-ascorbate metabolism protein UlaG (beta-lactamase superfamily)
VARPARHGVPEITFIPQGSGKTIFFGGDTLRIPELDEVPRRFPSVDLALLPVNAVPIHAAETIVRVKATGEPLTLSD